MRSKPFKGGWRSTAALGAAFLMANSSIGPGFLTQTTVFTQQLLTSFGFVILVSVIIDLFAQLNTWRVLTASGLRAQDLSNRLMPGLGYLLTFLVVLGGFAFNIGNIAGCGLGINVLTGLTFEKGALISGGVALLLFWVREIGKMLDGFTIVLGCIKIGLTLFIAIAAHPPLLTSLEHTVAPVKISITAIVTIVGGTVGGYLTFSGAHRLLDAGIRGTRQQKVADRSAISGILISACMRFILFLAAAGVLIAGAQLDENNPAATVFRSAAGEAGFRIFGIVLWSAAISSVVGASYTSVSFFKTFHPWLQKNERLCISVFIALTTLVFVAVGRPKQLLLLAGAFNGMILPFSLAIMLIASTRKSLVGEYRPARWLLAGGWLVVAVMGWMGAIAIGETMSAFFK